MLEFLPIFTPHSSGFDLDPGAFSPFSFFFLAKMNSNELSSVINTNKCHVLSFYSQHVECHLSFPLELQQESDRVRAVSTIISNTHSHASPI